MVPYSIHAWRLFVPDDEDFAGVTELQKLVAQTEPADIDHWFRNGMSIFSGRGTLPEHPRILPKTCFDCGGMGCYTCCFTQVTYHWVGHLTQESIDGLQHIIHDLAPEQ